MKIKARDVRAGDRVVLGARERVLDVDLVGIPGCVRGTCILFAIGENVGVSVGLDEEIELLQREEEDTTPNEILLPHQEERIRRIVQEESNLPWRDDLATLLVDRDQLRARVLATLPQPGEAAQATARRCLKPLLQRPVTPEVLDVCEAVTLELDRLGRERDDAFATLSRVRHALDGGTPAGVVTSPCGTKAVAIAARLEVIARARRLARVFQSRAGSLEESRAWILDLIAAATRLLEIEDKHPS
ncbi:conserved protein of unknown function [Rhodovastum atsumiense]|uniref:Uncharacterized protein n=1 Tax=Rhodovastum atsumiense TaxID=504468 RepID=A0A5M6J1V2_9PROT|nr:hypothetical protein [Rhodovastum atsumiense]KAA5614586.1 hypothetical protein F1189_00165 [Rhodovastum atsumiense]CAH2599919.1 conserved protein of unknown function [Rhodovastum atsumiense]